MSIIEPTGWAVDCDNLGCPVQQDQEDHVDDERYWRSYLRECGWVLVDDYTFCSIDCLLAHRSDQSNRRHMSGTLQIHAKFDHSALRCCPEHGHHVPDGLHSLNCPERRRR